MSTLLTLRIQLAHSIDLGTVTFRPIPDRPGNALAQFEAELQRIVREEVEAALRVRQVRREEEQRDG